MSYFDINKKRHATDTLKKCYKCAEKAGIRHALFVNFGLLLGIVREKDYISHDSDVDMCIKQELITPEQEILYRNYLKDEGILTDTRDKYSVRPDEDGYDELQLFERDEKKVKYVIKCAEKGEIADYYGKPVGKKVRLTWFTLRPKPGYPKFCHWFMFPWNGCYWHTKAGKWVSERKFTHRKWDYKKTDEAIMKGIPVEFLENLVTVNFYGVDIQIPENLGILHFMYNNWLIPKRGGASSKKIVCVVGKWKDRKTWRISIA